MFKKIMFSIMTMFIFFGCTEYDDSYLTNEITELQELIKTNSSTLDEYKSALDNTTNELNKTKEELDKSNDELNNTNKNLSDYKSELNNTKDELNKVNLELNNTKDELNKVNSDLNNYIESTKPIENKVDVFNVEYTCDFSTGFYHLGYNKITFDSSVYAILHINPTELGLLPNEHHCDNDNTTCKYYVNYKVGCLADKFKCDSSLNDCTATFYIQNLPDCSKDKLSLVNDIILSEVGQSCDQSFIPVESSSGSIIYRSKASQALYWDDDKKAYSQYNPWQNCKENGSSCDYTKYEFIVVN